MMSYRLLPLFLAGVVVATAACGAPDAEHAAASADQRAPGQIATARDTIVEAMLDAAGVAEPVQQATLSTKLMGTVTAVLVREGDQVAVGQPLVRIDARDLEARQSQVSAGIAVAAAVHREAVSQVGRIRALYADSAATRAQLDAAETGLVRSEAAVKQATASASELAMVADYSVVRAPFSGMVTQRFVDPGAFATPGAPLVTVQDSRRLRVSVTAAPEAVRRLRRGASIIATIGNVRVTATVEGVVPAPGGSVYTVNAIVDNHSALLLSGSAATLSLPQGSRHAVMIPSTAVRREGDLTGVLVRGTAGDELRWVRLGTQTGNGVEVLGGLEVGDQVVVPSGVVTLPIVGDSRGN